MGIKCFCDLLDVNYVTMGVHCHMHDLHSGDQNLIPAENQLVRFNRMWGVHDEEWLDSLGWERVAIVADRIQKWLWSSFYTQQRGLWDFFFFCNSAAAKIKSKTSKSASEGRTVIWRAISQMASQFFFMMDKAIHLGGNANWNSDLCWSKWDDLHGDGPRGCWVMWACQRSWRQLLEVLNGSDGSRVHPHRRIILQQQLFAAGSQPVLDRKRPCRLFISFYLSLDLFLHFPFISFMWIWMLLFVWTAHFCMSKEGLDWIFNIYAS